MAVMKTVAIIVLSISSAVFVALFGRLPLFRKTPIGLLHRVLWIHVPHLFSGLDARLTNGRISSSLRRSEHYLLYEPHPLVLIFFLVLLLASEVLFIPPAWPLISRTHHLLILTLTTIPYVTLYHSVTTTSSVTPTNHPHEMTQYPYDRILFHPAQICRTCKLPKPARSKHCTICGVCVSKHDHHCVWLNNCVGRRNYISFLTLLLSLSVLLAYGAWLGYRVLETRLQSRFVPDRLARGSVTRKHWSTKLNWTEYAHHWSFAVSTDVRIGAVALFSALTFPLSTGLLVYHLYLIWAGMTTNESAKWADLRDDIADGIVWKAPRSELVNDYPPLEERVEPRRCRWPAQSRWWVCRIRGGMRPHYCRRGGSGRQRSVDGGGCKEDTGVVDPRWKQVMSLSEVVNVYDLGFWSNLQDVWLNRG